MTEVEFNKMLDAILPKIVGGMVRPDEPIPTDLDFSTAFRQFLQQDANLADHENAFLRRLLSNDKRLQEWVDQIFDALSKQDFNLATTKLKGLMSAVDKTKLDGIQNGAEINQNSFSVIKAGATNITATSESDMIEFAAGTNIALTPAGKKITVGVTGIANGAEINQNAFSSVQVGTNKINATTKTDILNIAAGKNIEVVPDPATKKITIQVLGDLGINLRKASTAYAIGDIAYSPLLPSWARLECVAAGKTSASEIVIPANLSGGGYLVDGTVKWIVDDTRDGNLPGKIVGMMYLPAGYVKIAGATVNRNDYIRLKLLADKYGLWTTDTVNNPGKFGVGNGSTTMVLPDWRGVVRRFLDDGKGYDVNRVLGTFQGDAIRNIVGSVGEDGVLVRNIPNSFTYAHRANLSGAFAGKPVFMTLYSVDATGTADARNWIVSADFNAGRVVPTASENRVRNIAEMAVMRY